MSLLNFRESQVNVVRYPLCVSSPIADNINRRDQNGKNHHISLLCMLNCECEGITSTCEICERVCDMLVHDNKPEDVIEDNV